MDTPKLDRNTSKVFKKLLQKVKPIHGRTHRFEGSFTISNIKVYEDGLVLVDISFDGKLFAKVDNKKDYYGSDVLARTNISKIKVKRFIRKVLFPHVKNLLLGFSFEIHHYSQIKKVDWKPIEEKIDG